MNNGWVFASLEQRDADEYLNRWLIKIIRKGGRKERQGKPMSRNQRQKKKMEESMEQFTFYELYADILQSMDDVSAGKLASRICAYEFEDREPAEEMTDRGNFYWSNIADILREVKETESIGKMPKKYNLQFEHFTFYETYYKAMKLMNVRKQGIFVKAVCAYMFGNEELKFEDRTLQGYFSLCKRKMDLSMKRKASGRTGGAKEKKGSGISPAT